jgi:hypothetical protein
MVHGRAGRERKALTCRVFEWNMVERWETGNVYIFIYIYIYTYIHTYIH